MDGSKKERAQARRLIAWNAERELGWIHGSKE